MFRRRKKLSLHQTLAVASLCLLSLATLSWFDRDNEKFHVRIIDDPVATIGQVRHFQNSTARSFKRHSVLIAYTDASGARHESWARVSSSVRYSLERGQNIAIDHSMANPERIVARHTGLPEPRLNRADWAFVYAVLGLGCLMITTLASRRAHSARRETAARREPAASHRT